MVMKWLEITCNADDEPECRLINLCNVISITWDDEYIVLMDQDESRFIIYSESHDESKKKYNMIKSFMNYGPFPNVLTIESTGEYND